MICSRMDADSFLDPRRSFFGWSAVGSDALRSRWLTFVVCTVSVHRLRWSYLHAIFDIPSGVFCFVYKTVHCPFLFFGTGYVFAGLVARALPTDGKRRALKQADSGPTVMSGP